MQVASGQIPSYSAVPSWINAVTVVVLAVITWWYARSAKRQANAASKQAKAAELTLAHLQSEIEEHKLIGIAMLVGSVLELKAAVDHWHERMTRWGAIAETVNASILPNEWAISLERAKQIPLSLYQELQNLQRSSRAVSRGIEQFTAMAVAYRGQMQADEIKKQLAKLSNDCIAVFNKLGNFLPPGLIDGYLDK